MICCEFHTHTTFSDGKNTAEEMVLSAIGRRLKTIGFSDHAYVPFDPMCSMSAEKTLLYRREIARLKEKYADKIQILCGIEMDYYSIDDADAYDYVIGSVHYLSVGGKTYSIDLSPEETQRCIAEGFGGDIESYAQAYFEKVSQIKDKTGADIIGHFDLITKFEQTIQMPCSSPRYISAWKTALNQLAGKALLEINTGAMARGYKTTPYPASSILEQWKNLGGRVILSGDAHKTETIAYGFDRAAAYVKQCGYTDDQIVQNAKEFMQNA